MQYLGVICAPGARSLSPVFQQAALDYLDLGIRYESWPTPANGLQTRVTGLRAPSVLGANVTIPHKETVIPLLDELDELARKVGAVNTIVNGEGRLVGHNTDGEGFLLALRQKAGFEPRGCRAVIAGAGGAAKAVVVALVEAGTAEVTIINRTRERADRLVALCRDVVAGAKVRSLQDDAERWGEALTGADLLVNCTSLGSAGSAEVDLSPAPPGLIRPDMLVYDLVYRPSRTLLLREAESRGARTLGGLPMLVYQGAASFRIWTEKEAPLDVMFAAAEAALAAEEHAG